MLRTDGDAANTHRNVYCMVSLKQMELVFCPNARALVSLCSACPSRRRQRKSNYISCRDWYATGKEHAVFGEVTCVFLSRREI